MSFFINPVFYVIITGVGNTQMFAEPTGLFSVIVELVIKVSLPHSSPKKSKYIKFKAFHLLAQ